MSTTVKVGVVGCGSISGIYLRNCAKFDNLEVVACADRHIERAEDRARRYGVARFCTVPELLADPDIEVVLNLTVPASHAEIGVAALQAGKSVYNEKPLTAERDTALQMLNLAENKGLLVGCAPDTFLSGHIQTCRRLIDDGAIGQIIGASIFIFQQRPETWHPAPDFFYQPGAGPIFDLGPYYLTALTALLGPVRRVSASAKISFPERLITSESRAGEKITVRTPTHAAGVLNLESGAMVSLVASFDIWATQAPRLEIYGSDGVLSVSDPNSYGGPLRMYSAASGGWAEAPITYGYTRNSRGIGLSDMADAMRDGRAPRASGALAYHVLDTMQAILDSSQQGRPINLSSGVPRPEPMPEGSGDPHFAELSDEPSVEHKLGDLLANTIAKCKKLEP